jgi:hypothetical protein
MILTLADTLWLGAAAVYMPSVVTMPVKLKNSHPIHEMILPIKFGGDLATSYLSWNIEGCRTDGHQTVQLVAIDQSNGVLAFRISSDPGGPPLPPGTGPILNLAFYQYGGGVCTIDTTTKVPYSLEIDAFYESYQPVVVPGHIYRGVCGNLDGDSQGLVDIGDLTILIDYLYITHSAPAFVEQANVDGSEDGVIDIGDLTYLIAYLYIKGPPPVCP